VGLSSDGGSALGATSLVNQLLPSQTYEISETKGWEFTVDGLSITSIHKRNIPREKKLTLKKILKKRKKDGQ
jgi:hypothetical protein